LPGTALAHNGSHVSWAGLVRFGVRPLSDLAATLDGAVAGADHPWRSLAAMVAVAAATWFLYVPFHELLHVAGCVATGGAVRRMTLDPLYGGRLLSRILPFVEAGGDHAGRLQDFSIGGSDLTYLATDAAPYLLTLAGVPMLRAAARRRSAALAGAAAVLALSPFMSLAGDYYEMGSIIVTRIAAPFDPPPEPGEAASGLMALRSDDLTDLISRVRRTPDRFVAEAPGGAAGVASVIVLSAATGGLLALGTYAAGGAVATRLFHLAPPPGALWGN
jgi:hypothetical protein